MRDHLKTALDAVDARLRRHRCSLGKARPRRATCLPHHRQRPQHRRHTHAARPPRRVHRFRPPRLQDTAGSIAPASWPAACRSLTNAQIQNPRWRRRGIATPVYQLIASELQRSGGDRLEPHFGSMSADTVAFWEARRPEYGDRLAELNAAGALSALLFD